MTHLAQLRRAAFRHQAERCYYCRCRMWERALPQFAATTGLTLAQAAQRRATAEHLTPRAEGGRDTARNIVAACLFCNRRRGRARPKAPSPEAYAHKVRRLCALGRWWPWPVAHAV